ncbi:MAG: PAS domain-containing protein [Pseudomonadota bacterium]
MVQSTYFSGVIPAQSALIRYWHQNSVAGRLPLREDFDPGVLRRYLDAVSLVELEPDGRMLFRLTGSKVRRLLGEDMRGRCLSELSGADADSWALGFSAVLERHMPVGGIISTPRHRHAWLRMPLMSQRGGMLVLCHDTLLPLQATNGSHPTESKSPSHRRADLAA